MLGASEGTSACSRSSACKAQRLRVREQGQLLDVAARFLEVVAADLPRAEPFTREIAAEVARVVVRGDDHADPPQTGVARPENRHPDLRP